MAGYTKHMFLKDLESMRNDLSKYISTLIPVLPKSYDNKTILILLEKYYPFEWRIINEKYKYYSKKDKSLAKRGKKPRYSMCTPEDLLQSLGVYQRIFSESYINAHAENFSDDTYLLNEQKLLASRMPKIQARIEKIDAMKRKVQLVEPVFLDSLMGLYDRKNTSQKDRVYILKELEKYYCPKVINFFQKKVDTEYNRQLREMAFYHLQRLGYFTGPLRKQKYMRIHTQNKKRRKFLKEVYAYERYNIAEMPEELEYRILNAKEQSLKSFDYFISHNSNDFSAVQQLIQDLNKKNLNVYCDWISDTDYLKRALVCGATLEVIRKRIEQSTAIIFVSSQHSRDSKWVRYELNYAYELKKPIHIIQASDIIGGRYTLSLHKDTWFLDDDYKNAQLF